MIRVIEYYDACGANRATGAHVTTFSIVQQHIDTVQHAQTCNSQCRRSLKRDPRGGRRDETGWGPVPLLHETIERERREVSWPRRLSKI